MYNNCGWINIIVSYDKITKSKIDIIKIVNTAPNPEVDNGCIMVYPKVLIKDYIYNSEESNNLLNNIDINLVNIKNIKIMVESKDKKIIESLWDKYMNN